MGRTVPLKSEFCSGLSVRNGDPGEGGLLTRLDRDATYLAATYRWPGPMIWDDSGWVTGDVCRIKYKSPAFCDWAHFRIYIRTLGTYVGQEWLSDLSTTIVISALGSGKDKTGYSTLKIDLPYDSVGEWHNCGSNYYEPLGSPGLAIDCLVKLHTYTAPYAIGTVKTGTFSITIDATYQEIVGVDVTFLSFTNISNSPSGNLVQDYKGRSFEVPALSTPIIDIQMDDIVNNGTFTCPDSGSQDVDFEQATAADKPTELSPFGISFDGASEFVHVVAADAVNWQDLFADDFSIAILYKKGAVGGPLFWAEESGSNEEFGIDSSAAGADTDWHTAMFTFRTFDGTANFRSVQYHDGQYLHGAEDDQAARRIDTFNLGYDANAATFFDGTIGHVMAWNQNIYDDELALYVHHLLLAKTL